MLNHDQMVYKALRDPHMSYTSSNFRYVTNGNKSSYDDSSRWFHYLGGFVSYSTTVANLVRNKLTHDHELHITTQPYSPTTDRQLSQLRWQAEKPEAQLVVYNVPYIHTKDVARMDPDFLQNTIQNVNSILNELLDSRRQYKTYVNQVKQCIEWLKYAMFLMTDTVPQEIYNEYFTTKQKDVLQEAINLRLTLGNLMHHCNEDGRILKQALLGLRELNK